MEMETLDRLIEGAVADGAVPACSLNVRVDGCERYHRTWGLARLEPPRTATEDQAFDLASVTKALVGSTVTASLIEEGALAPSTRIADHFPQVDPRLQLAHLLNHSSGLPAWAPLYEHAASWGTAQSRTRILKAVVATPLEAPPGQRHTYSDLGFLLLLAVIERVTGRPLDALFHERIQRPAGVTDLRWGWPQAAATERCPQRGVVVEGTVHDLNCAALGGVSTHAGLFGTARAVGWLAERLMQATTDPHGPLPGTTLARLWRLRGPGSHVGGWDTVTPGASSTGSHFPPDTVGHLGYTGTSIWVVPSRRTVVTFLTNRVHPVDDKRAIQALRPSVHDAVAVALGWAG